MPQLFYGKTYDAWSAEVDAYDQRLGRRPFTVGDLRLLIDNLPDETPVRVSHQPYYQRVGIQDPAMNVSEVATGYISDDGSRMYGGPPFVQKLIID